MEEKILKGKKNGMAMMLLLVAVYALAIFGLVKSVGGVTSGKGVALYVVLLVVCALYLILGGYRY